MKRILFIEEEVITVKRVIEQLKKNYEVDVVENGNSALDCLNQNQYNLVFLDIMLPHGEGKGIPKDIHPKQTGIEILKKIRNEGTRNSSQIPVVVLTGVSNGCDIEEIRKHKPTRLFQKPKELNVLYEAVVEAIESQ